MHEPPAELDGFRVVPGGTLAPRGFVGGGVAAGIKAAGALDLGAILSTRTPCQSAATFTSNRVCGASVTINKERLSKRPARGIVFNSGNSNVFTGARGRADGLAFIDAFAGRFGVPADEILVASTGAVIGFHLPMPKILAGVEALELTPDAGEAVARAMMTTDIGPKTLAIEVPVSGGTIRIGGAAKGAGMVHPNMATMFVFMTTDAELQGGTLQRLLSETVANSFNLLSIDGDQSTSDTALLLANGGKRNQLDPGMHAGRGSVCTRFAGGVPLVGAGDRARRRGRDEGLRRDGARSLGRQHSAYGGARGHYVVAGKNGDSRRRPKLGPDRHGSRQ